MAEYLILRQEPTASPPWRPAAIVVATLEEGGEVAIERYLSTAPSGQLATVPRWKAVRFDDGPEMVPTISVAPAGD